MSSKLFSRMKDFVYFVRFDLSFFGGFIAVLGYSMFRPIASDILLIYISSFCILALMFGYKRIEDRKDGFIGIRFASYLITRKWGRIFLYIIFLIGILSSFLASLDSLVFYLLLVPISLAYALLRLNVRPSSHIFKNSYSAFGLPLLFIFGAGIINIEVLTYYFLFSILLFSSSIIADLRDHEIDRVTGKRTLPTVIGYIISKTIACLLLFIFALLVIGFYTRIFLFGVIALTMIIMTIADRQRFANLLGGVGFLVNSIWFLVINY